METRLKTEETAPIAVKTITNSLVLTILAVNSNKVTVKWSNEDITHKLRLRYAAKRESPYFVLNGSRHYLDEFIRTDYPY